MTKKLLLIFLSLVTSFNVQSQSVFEQNFLGNEFLLYKGVFFKLIDSPSSGFDRAFYSNLKDCESYKDVVIYPDPKYYWYTVIDSLVNRVFIVENIIDVKGNVLKENSKQDPIFVLKDTLNEQIIYYKYDKKFLHSFPFKTSSINYKLVDYCSKIIKEKDDFTNELIFNSPMFNDLELLPMSISKNINKGKAQYYLSLNTVGNTVNFNTTGVIIIFSDGTKWSRTSKIDVVVGKVGYDYSAFIPLTASDITTFMTKKVKKFRLYIYDEEINPSYSEQFRIFAECLKNAK